ncbi:hypothetical protein BD408DRAFT_200185 [Parasitella parasitica]|nr:hypothetical protein BD408DRAFT_200185 [Parasitella parasitica]
MEAHEDIERARQIFIPGLLHHCTPVDQDLNRKLKEAYEKRMQLSKIVIRPLPHEDNIHEFQYLGRQDVEFKSTTTTKVLSSLWTIDNTNFDNLMFHQYNTSNPLKLEEFPSANIYKRRRSSTTIPLPEISFNDESQVGPDAASMPIIVKATTLKTKKTKAATASTQQHAPTQLLSTTQSQSQGSSLDHHNPTDTFANISTQPVEGAFGSRKKSVQKKKKAKSSGFK